MNIISEKRMKIFFRKTFFFYYHEKKDIWNMFKDTNSGLSEEIIGSFFLNHNQRVSSPRMPSYLSSLSPSSGWSTSPTALTPGILSGGHLLKFPGDFLTGFRQHL